MPNKRSITVIFTNHAISRMRERNFTQEGVQVVVNYGKEEILADGCRRYTLTDDSLSSVPYSILLSYFRGKQVILTPNNIVKTVINNDKDSPDFATYQKYVIL